MELIFVYITAPNHAEAERIGRELLRLRLAGCVNLVDGMHSLYWWEGKIDEARETILIAKTEKRLLDPLTDAVKRLHPYDTPCVVAFPITGGNPDYFQWLSTNVG